MKRTQRLNLTSWLTTGLLTWLLSGLGFTSLAFAEEPLNTSIPSTAAGAYSVTVTALEKNKGMRKLSR